MNFLAHLFLSDPTPESLAGNLGADFMTGACLGDLLPAVQEGVRRHHQVDIFTDSHPIVALSKERVRPASGRYSGILIDVFYDHFLAARWADFAEEPLPRFADRIYQALEENLDICPPALQWAIPHLRKQNWLVSYASVEGIELTLERISRRCRRPVRLQDHIDQLTIHYAGLEEDFLRFFPELIAHVRAPSLPGD